MISVFLLNLTSLNLFLLSSFVARFGLTDAKSKSGAGKLGLAVALS